MKKYFILTALAVWAFAFSSPLLSQVDGVWFRTVIKAEDAAGNIDTVVFYVKEGATKGIDAELGEINLYGQEPQGDLDIRIIQRTTDTDNIDLKVDYWFKDSLDILKSTIEPSFFLKVYAKHYPVSIYLTELTGICDSCIHCDWRQYNEEDGRPIAGTLRSADFVIPPLLLYTFDKSSENNWIWFRQTRPRVISVEENNQQPLYPNPSQELIVIENGELGEKFDIVNLEGRLIQSFTVESYPYSLNISLLPKGTYFLRNKNSEVINKFIKE